MDKLLENVDGNPKNDWKIADLQFIADRYGVDYATNGSLHVVFRGLDGFHLTVPARRPIKPVYIRAFVKFIREIIMKQQPINRYEIRELTRDEGGGYLVTFPDLPGCMSDGDSVEEALINAADAERGWLVAAKKWGTQKCASAAGGR